MGKGSWRRPTGPGFDENYCANFPNSRGCAAQRAQDQEDAAKAERQERAEFVMQRAAEREKRLIALSLDELRTIVFETSVAYADAYAHASTQEAEWERAAALKAALERLGYERESEMIGGAA